MTPSRTHTYHFLRDEMVAVAEHYEDLAALMSEADPIIAHRLRDMALLARKIVRSTDLRIADLAAVDKDTTHAQ